MQYAKPGLLLALVVVLCHLQESSGHYYRRYSYRRPGTRSSLYSMGSRNRYRPSYRSRNEGSMRRIFNSIYNRYRNQADDHDDRDFTYRGFSTGNLGLGSSIDYDDSRNRIVIRLPPNIITPNFKMSDLPFYLASGLFDPQNLPGTLGSQFLGSPSLPKPIVDPINPGASIYDFDDNDDFNNDLNQILGGGANTNLLGVANPNILGGANTNLLGGANPNILGGANPNILGGANTNLLGGANPNLLGGANPNLLGGANPNLLGGTNSNLLGGANTNLLGGANTNLLGGTNSNLLGGANTNLLGGANTNLLGGTNSNLLGGANTNLLGGANANLLGGANTGIVGSAGGVNPGLVSGTVGNTDYFNTKTGTGGNLLGTGVVG